MGATWDEEVLTMLSRGWKGWRGKAEGQNINTSFIPFSSSAHPLVLTSHQVPGHWDARDGLPKGTTEHSLRTGTVST